MAEPWWRDAVIYQIYPRSFQDTDGDGVGDLTGIAERLDYVASLGVDAVWISPFFPSPGRDFGYDVSDHTGVDPQFGTMADFDRVVERAHGLGLKIIVDMVWAHTSDRHPWFRDHPDRYVWADPRPDGTPPNNWLSVFGGPAWTWDSRRRQYYLHHFLPSQPALDWRNPETVAAVLEIGRFWRDKGVDGIRLDAIDFLLHDELLRSNPVRPLAEIPTKPFGMQQHVHDMIQDGALPLLERIRALGVATLGELSSVGDPVARAETYTAPGRLDLAYTLGLMRRPFTAPSLAQAIAEVEAKMVHGRLCWAFANHDIERPVSRWGDGSPAAACMMLALLIALNGAICLYQGEELGLPEADLPFERLKDPYGIAFWPEYKGRDGCRTPMPWSADAAEAGFTSGAPWLPIPAAHRPLAVDRQEADGASPLNILRRLLRWRKGHPAVLRGTAKVVAMEGLLAFERACPEERILCVFNPSAEARRLPLPGAVLEGVGYGVASGELVFDGWGGAFCAL